MDATPPKLSLVAQFDDLCRQLRDDAENEDLFLDFVQNQEACRQRWLAAKLENAELKRQIATLQDANTELSSTLAHTKRVLAEEVLSRQNCERELLLKEQQLDQIRAFMMNGTENREEALVFPHEVDDMKPYQATADHGKAHRVRSLSPAPD
ncbi:uncharacterized protein LOC144163867 [Haemaphysalis longicornis]